jgi:acetylornithine aminotransferase
MPDPGYLSGLREICDRHNWLLMLDEIQTGMCRSGKWFAFQHEDLFPDVMTLAKGLANGVPIGACLAKGPAAEVFQPGTHGSTFGGNPLAARAALAVIDTLEQENLASRAATLGARLLSTLQEQLAGVDHLREVRGLGLLLAIELDCPCGELVGKALEQGLLINVTAERVIRLLPPLVISDEQVDVLVGKLVELVRNFGAAK